MPGVVFGHLDTAVPETSIAVDSILLLETETILKIIVMDRVILVMFSFWRFSVLSTRYNVWHSLGLFLISKASCVTHIYSH